MSDTAQPMGARDLRFGCAVWSARMLVETGPCNGIFVADQQGNVWARMSVRPPGGKPMSTIAFVTRTLLHTPFLTALLGMLSHARNLDNTYAGLTQSTLEPDGTHRESPRSGVATLDCV